MRCVGIDPGYGRTKDVCGKRMSGQLPFPSVLSWPHTPGSGDYIPEAPHILQAYTRTVISTVQAFLDMTHDVDICLMGGGGARFLLPDRDYDFLIVDNPETVNVIDYWAWAISHLA